MSTNPSYKIIPGKNPFAEQLREKISALETYQTPRTSKEFLDTVISILASQNVTMRSSFFFDRINYLIFEESNSEIFGRCAWKRCTLKNVVYSQTTSEKEIVISALPAYRISDLFKEIHLGRVHARELMPVEVVLNQQCHKINYSGKTTRIARAGYS